MTTGDFVVNVPGEYAIDISAKGNIPVDELGCLLGNDMYSTCRTRSVVRVRWSLLNNGRMIDLGASDNFTGGGAVFSTGEAFRTVGYFTADKNQRYKLNVDVLSDGSKLAVANPHLVVRAVGTRYESGLILSEILSLVCIIVGLLGASLLLWSVLIRSNPVTGVR